MLLFRFSLIYMEELTREESTPEDARIMEVLLPDPDPFNIIIYSTKRLMKVILRISDVNATYSWPPHPSIHRSSAGHR